MIPIADLLADHQEFHSDLQMDSFITVRNGGTLYGCYKQALRELAARVRALRERFFALEQLKLEIDAHLSTNTPRDRLLASQKRLTLPEAVHALEHTEREFGRFYAQCLALREKLKVTGVEFPLDGATRHRLDCEMWIHHIKCQAAIAALGGGRLGSSTIELLQSLPNEMRNPILNEIFDRGGVDRLISWYLQYEVDLPLPPSLPHLEPLRLVGCSG